MLGRSFYKCYSVCSDLVLLCLDNTLIKYDKLLYKQKKGIPTGENHSVSLANIAMHYVVTKIEIINKNTFLFKRFIDDIIYITKDDEKSEIINKR